MPAMAGETIVEKAWWWFLVLFGLVALRILTMWLGLGMQIPILDDLCMWTLRVLGQMTGWLGHIVPFGR
jgi:hypothetical protein